MNPFKKYLFAHWNAFLALSTGTLIVLIAVVFILSESAVTPHNLAKIKTGMTPDQVKAILGHPDQDKTQGIPGLSSTTYFYHHGQSEIRFVFINNRLLQKEGQIGE